MERCLLRKEQVGAVERKITVYLVRRDLMIPFDSVLAAGIEQYTRPNDIRLQENLGAFNRAVDMGLRRKVYNDVRLFSLKERIDRRTVGDVPTHKRKLRILPRRVQRRQIPRIRQRIIADNTIFRMFTQLVVNEIRTDKPGFISFRSFSCSLV